MSTSLLAYMVTKYGRMKALDKALLKFCEIHQGDIYLFAEHRRHQILPGLVYYGDIGFQGIVPHLSTSTAYLCGYDHLLLP